MTSSQPSKERLIQEVHTLPDTLVGEALDFIAFIKARHQQVSPLYPPSSLPETEKQALIHAIQSGKYAHLPNSSDDFARRKQTEIDWEERDL
jgi:hypothetical protein